MDSLLTNIVSHVPSKNLFVDLPLFVPLCHFLYCHRTLKRSRVTMIVLFQSIDVKALRSAVGDGFIVMIDERQNTAFPEIVTLLEYSRRNPFRLTGIHAIEFDVSLLPFVCFASACMNCGFQWQKLEVSTGRVYNAVFFSIVAFNR